MFKQYKTTISILIIFLLICTILYREYYHIQHINDLCENQEFVEDKRYLEKQMDLLTRVINSESHGENLLDKLLVGSVVINRMNLKSQDQDLEQVIFSKNQFSGINSKLFKDISDGAPKTIESKLAALILLQYGPIDSNIIYFINPKHATDKHWKRKVMQRELVFKNNKHYFYR